MEIDSSPRTGWAMTSSTRTLLLRVMNQVKPTIGFPLLIYQAICLESACWAGSIRRSKSPIFRLCKTTECRYYEFQPDTGIGLLFLVTLHQTVLTHNA